MVLLFTGVAKLFTAFSGTALYRAPEPVFGIKFWLIFCIAGGIEVVIGLFCLFGKNAVLLSVMVATFATELLAYRIGLKWIDYHTPCNCLGEFSSKLHISDALADNIMASVLAFLLAGSYLIAGRELLLKSKSTAALVL